MAPKPITPSFLPMISVPANAFLAFSAALPMLGSSALSRHHWMPPAMSRAPIIRPAITSSLTALALAPGVLNTTMPASAHLSSGMLFTPAPARAIARKPSGNSTSCSDALRTRMPSAWERSSVSL